ncbi:hypothetical protein CspeluHIS016_0301160 [Cutaneotrichosporon spelunceum]|uniref:Uncharacterized protein n=1 Tax=Cutaneotrichosporon spelunceum TaxID=1672016 RepID=A0AAD3TSV6_9TREE|nr:hypothetical protein CspeluHIS016_0301160 [Cutaneotrichosporon spelunceum]
MSFPPSPRTPKRLRLHNASPAASLSFRSTGNAIDSAPSTSPSFTCSSMNAQPSTAASAHAPGSWRDTGRPMPLDVLVVVANYLGDMMDGGDVEARATLASMMRLSRDGLDAAARPLYSSITVNRDTFSEMFGGNDLKKSKLFEHPVTFPTRQSVIRKLGLFQHVKHMQVEDLPNEQAVSDLVDAFRVACSQPASGVACQQALSGRLLPRLEGVSFGPNVFLNHNSVPPLGPEMEGGIHRFLALLLREAEPTHMCVHLPTPADIAMYQAKHRRAERPGPAPYAAFQDVNAPAEPQTSLTKEAKWPTSLARAWRIKTISAHNVRFTRLTHLALLTLPCDRLRIFALDDACPVAMCEDGSCAHCGHRWNKAAAVLISLAHGDRNESRFKVVEVANAGAGFPLKCGCVVQYANAIAALKRHMRNSTVNARWTIDLPHCAEAVNCECCGASVAQTGDTGDGIPNGSVIPAVNCTEGHFWLKGFLQQPFIEDAAAAAGPAQGAVPVLPVPFFTLTINPETAAPQPVLAPSPPPNALAGPLAGPPAFHTQWMQNHMHHQQHHHAPHQSIEHLLQLLQTEGLDAVLELENMADNDED